MKALKYEGYFDNNFEFEAFSAAPVEEKRLIEVDLGNEGDDYSYIISGVFHPPQPDTYFFRTRSDDASHVVVDGKLLVDNGNLHGSRTREASVRLEGPAKITMFFGQRGGGAKCEFEWRGGRQDKYTRRLGLFTPLEEPIFPDPYGMKAMKFDGYFDNDFEFPAFEAAPAKETLLPEVKLGNEGERYSYLITGMFHPPTVPGDYSFRTRSDDASYIIVNGKQLTDDGNEHGMRTREGTVHLTGPTQITLIFGQNRGGAGLEFEWKGMGQNKWTRRLGLFTPLDNPTLPPPSGMLAKKFDGYFDDDFEFPAFKAAPKDEKTLREVKLGNEGEKYSYMITGQFHPPTVPGTYSFRTRSDDASYIVVRGALEWDGSKMCEGHKAESRVKYLMRERKMSEAAARDQIMLKEFPAVFRTSTLLVDDGNHHGMRTREGTVKLDGPADITVFFGQDKGGAGLEFEWKGEGQNKWTRRLGLFTPLDQSIFPPPMGMRLKRYDGYFDNDFDFPAFKEAPKEVRSLRPRTVWLRSWPSSRRRWKASAKLRTTGPRRKWICRVSSQISRRRSPRFTSATCSWMPLRHKT